MWLYTSCKPHNNKEDYSIWRSDICWRRQLSYRPLLWTPSFGFAHFCKILCKTNFVFNFGSFLLSYIFVSGEKISCLKLGARFILILISTNTTFARKMLFLIEKVFQKSCFQNTTSLPCQFKKAKKRYY